MLRRVADQWQGREGEIAGVLISLSALQETINHMAPARPRVRVDSSPHEPGCVTVTSQPCKVVPCHWLPVRKCNESMLIRLLI